MIVKCVLFFFFSLVNKSFAFSLQDAKPTWFNRNLDAEVGVMTREYFISPSILFLEYFDFPRFSHFLQYFSTG